MCNCAAGPQECRSFTSATAACTNCGLNVPGILFSTTQLHTAPMAGLLCAHPSSR